MSTVYVIVQSSFFTIILSLHRTRRIFPLYVCHASLLWRTSDFFFFFGQPSHPEIARSLTDLALTYPSFYLLQQRALASVYRSPPSTLRPLVDYVLEFSTPPKLSICFEAKLLIVSSAGARLNVRHVQCTNHGQMRHSHSTSQLGTKPRGRPSGMRLCRAMLRDGCARPPSRLVPATSMRNPRPRPARQSSSIHSTFLLS
jgi:hypothetical protein